MVWNVTRIIKKEQWYQIEKIKLKKKYWLYNNIEDLRYRTQQLFEDPTVTNILWEFIQQILRIQYKPTKIHGAHNMVNF